MAVKAEQGQAGLADWPDDLRCRKPEAIAAAKQRLAGAVDYYKAVQFFFYTQWNALKAYANGKGVRLVGDIPIYVSPDSSDLWTHPELFQQTKLWCAGCWRCWPQCCAWAWRRWAAGRWCWQRWRCSGATMP
jgi:4-alpha-glucanotransferase